MAMCGPSNDMQQAESGQLSLAQTMSNAFTQRFASQSQLLQNINESLTPVLAKGPEQQGFSAEELAARNTQAINSSAAANRNASMAAGNVIAGQGVGGFTDSSGLESGIHQAVKGSIASSAANELANMQGEITNENYAVGRSNYKTALAGASALSGEYNPQSFASGAQGGYGAAFGEADTINKQKQAMGKDILAGTLSLAKSAMGGLGNLDTTGSSSAGEQALNFFGGMA